MFYFCFICLFCCLFVLSIGSDDQRLEVDVDHIIGSDGAYSAVRRELMKRPRWGLNCANNHIILLYAPWVTGGSQRTGIWEKEGGVYGKQERKGQEAGSRKQESRGMEEGRGKGKDYATLHNILQSKKCKEVGANKNRAGTGIKWYGKWGRSKPSCPPPPPPNKGGRKREKGKIMQHSIIFCKQKRIKKQELTNVGQELGLKGTESILLSPLKVLTGIWCSKVSTPRH